MAFITADINIPETFNTLTTRLYFPTDLPAEVGNKVKGVITLLHGLGNSSADWMMMSSACRYAADNGYILIAPDAANSFYTNMAFGAPWYTILTELLPAQLQAIFNIPTARDINYIAGLSMGGYGAMRIGLSHPERYEAVASFSGALDIHTMAEGAKPPLDLPFLKAVLGPELEIPDEQDLLKLLEKLAALPAEQRPRLYTTCGLQDTEPPNVRKQTETFRAAAEKLKVDCAYREWSGVHEWNFWDRCLAEFIGFIQSSDYGARKRGDWH